MQKKQTQIKEETNKRIKANTHINNMDEFLSNYPKNKNS